MPGEDVKTLGRHIDQVLIEHQSSIDWVLVVYQPICWLADTVFVSLTLAWYCINTLPIVCWLRLSLGHRLSIGRYSEDQVSVKYLSICRLFFLQRYLTLKLWCKREHQVLYFGEQKYREEKRKFGFVLSYIWMIITDRFKLSKKILSNTLNRGVYIGGDRALDKSYKSLKDTSYYLFYCTTTMLHVHHR